MRRIVEEINPSAMERLKNINAEVEFHQNCKTSGCFHNSHPEGWYEVRIPNRPDGSAVSLEDLGIHEVANGSCYGGVFDSYTLA